MQLFEFSIRNFEIYFVCNIDQIESQMYNDGIFYMLIIVEMRNSRVQFLRLITSGYSEGDLNEYSI